MSNHFNDKNNNVDLSIDLSVDKLFPSDIKSGTRGKKLDVESLFSNTPLNKEPDITFSSDILLKKREIRREKKLQYYKQMLQYCYTRITDADDDLVYDIVFTIVETIPDCKEYDPLECLEYISVKLREENFDTTILSPITMFITWKFLELKNKDHDISNNDKSTNDKSTNDKSINDKSTNDKSTNDKNTNQMTKKIREIIVN